MKNETANSADYKMVKFKDPATGKIKFRKVKHDYSIVKQEEGMYGRRRDPFKSAQRSAKYKEAEAEYEREKEFLQKRKQQKSVKKESSKEYGKSLDRIRDKEKKAKIKPSELDKLARLRSMMKNANNEGKTSESVAGVLVKKAAKAAAVGAAGARGAMAAKSLLSKDEDKNKKESVDGQKSFSQYISELTDKQKAEVAARKAKNLAKRGARRGPSKGTKSSEGDWTAQQQKSANPLSFEIGKNDKHDAVHKTLAKAADASHPSLGGRKVKVKINGKSKEMAHKDLQHAVDLHKRLPLGKKAAVMNLIRDKGHDGVTAAANHFRKTYK